MWATNKEQQWPWRGFTLWQTKNSSDTEGGSHFDKQRTAVTLKGVHIMTNKEQQWHWRGFTLWQTKNSSDTEGGSHYDKQRTAVTLKGVHIMTNKEQQWHWRGLTLWQTKNSSDTEGGSHYDNDNSILLHTLCISMVHNIMLCKQCWILTLILPSVKSCFLWTYIVAFVNEKLTQL